MSDENLFEPSDSDSQANNVGDGDGVKAVTSTELSAGSRVISTDNTPLVGSESNFIDVEAKIKPEVSMDTIMAILRADAARNKNDTTLVFNHDVLEPFTKQLNESIQNLTAIPEMAEAYRYYVDKAVHKAVAENYTSLYKPDGAPINARTQESLEARKHILEAAAEYFKDDAHDLTVQLEVASYPAGQLRQNIKDSMTNEVRRLKKKLDVNLQPATLGEVLFMKAQDQFGKIFSNGDLAGDVQAHRNRHINASLFTLHQLTGELKANAGNPAWVKSHGQTTMAETERVQNELQEFTKGFEAKLNKRAFNGQMSDIGKATIDAYTQTDDEEFKKRLKALAESVRALIERVEKLIDRALNSLSGPKP